jgi:C-terminal processing protease CtpA/Prc
MDTTASMLSVESRRASKGPAIGYLRLRRFGPGVAAELERALAGAEMARLKGLVLDLRDNGGGMLPEAISVADAFIKDGSLGIVVEKGPVQQRKDLPARNSGHEPEGALVVLVNKRTASASELVAAAIKNLGRGIVVGEPTAGAASVRVVFEISKGRSRATPPPARDPSRDVVQDILDGKVSSPPPPVRPQHDDEALGLLLVTGKLLASGGAPIEGAGVVPDLQPTCGEPARAGDDCLLRIAQEAIVQAHDAQRPALLSAAKAVAAPASP